MSQAPISRTQYAAASIVLHWAIALAIFGMIPLGWWMADAIKEPETRTQAYAAFQLHKSIGLTVLALSVARLGVRFLNPPPPLPESIPDWQRMASNATHALLYGVMIGLPLTGWIYVSTGYTAEGQKLEVPTQYFGLFQWPHLPAPHTAAAASTAMSAHSALAWGAIGLAALHVAAALKHHFVDKDVVLSRMVPGLAQPTGEPAPSTPQRRLSLGVGFGLIALALIGVAGALASLPKPSLETAALEAPPPQTAPASDITAPASAAPLPAARPSPSQDAAATPSEAQIAAAAAAPQSASEAAPSPPTVSARPPTVWTIDPKASEVGFSGVHAGARFTGRFERWTAQVRFSPESLPAARAVVTFETGSAKTGDATRDSALPGPEWFDSARQPTARFESTAFKALGGDRYEARGNLILKGKSTAVTLPFTFTQTGGQAKVEGALTLDRIAMGLGLESDPGAEWVSREIRVTIRLSATAT